MNSVQYPETIEYIPFPVYTEQVVYPQTSTSVKDVQEPAKVNTPNTFPITPLSYDVLSKTIDTKRGKILGNYTFTENGAIKVGKYESGVSGEVAITPNGITAKNVNNETTISIDGSTGDVAVKGTLQAGSVIAGAVNVGDSSVQIDGANARIIINDGTTNRGVFGNV